MAETNDYTELMRGVLPTVFHQVREFIVVFRALYAELETIREKAAQIESRRHPAELPPEDEEGIDRWIAALGLAVSGILDAEGRIALLREALKDTRPYTEAALKALVRELAGSDATVTIDRQNKTVRVRANALAHLDTSAIALRLQHWMPVDWNVSVTDESAVITDPADFGADADPASARHMRSCVLETHNGRIVGNVQFADGFQIADYEMYQPLTLAVITNPDVYPNTKYARSCGSLVLTQGVLTSTYEVFTEYVDGKYLIRTGADVGAHEGYAWQAAMSLNYRV